MDQQIEKVEPHDLTYAVWFGKGASAIGLVAEVCRADLEKLFNGFRTLKG